MRPARARRRRVVADEDARRSRARRPRPRPRLRPRAQRAGAARTRHLPPRRERFGPRDSGALVGELDVPASTVTCAGCHGARGEGKTEGGVTAGNLDVGAPLKPYGHTHPTGRRHGPFDEASFARAVTGGVDPAGNNMLAAMPRYKMSAGGHGGPHRLPQAHRDRPRPRASPTRRSRSARYCPSKGALAETGEAMRDVLAAFFEDVNAQAAESTTASRAARGRLRAALRRPPGRAQTRAEAVFAFVGG